MDKKEQKPADGKTRIRNPLIMTEEERYEAQQNLAMESIASAYAHEEREKSQALIRETAGKEIPNQRIKETEINSALREKFSEGLGKQIDELCKDPILLEAKKFLIESLSNAQKTAEINQQTAAEAYLIGEGRLDNIIESAIKLQQKEIDDKARKRIEKIEDEIHKKMIIEMIKATDRGYFADPKTSESHKRTFGKTWEAKTKKETDPIKEKAELIKEQIAAQLRTLSNNLFEKKLDFNQPAIRKAVKKSAIKILNLEEAAAA